MNLTELLPYFDSYQKAGGGRYMAACPMPDHRDSDPSVSVCQDVNTGAILMFCWGCKTRGVELIEAMGLHRRDLFGDPGHSAAVDTAGFTATEINPLEQTALEERCRQAVTSIDLAKNYILTRFDLSTDEAASHGLGVDEGFGARYLIIPFKTPAGEIVGMQGRRLVDGEPRWRSVSGGGWSKIGCFNWDADGPVIITEGPSDALSVVGRANLSAIAIRGASNTEAVICDRIKDWIGERPALVIGDNGEAGERFAKEISEGVGVPYWIPPGDFSDVSEYLADGGTLNQVVALARSCVDITVAEEPVDLTELQRIVQNDILAASQDQELVATLAHLSEEDFAWICLTTSSNVGVYPNTRRVADQLRHLQNVVQRTRPVDPPPVQGGGGGRAHAHLPPGAAVLDLPEIIWNSEDQLHITEHEIRGAMDAYEGNDFYRSATGQYVKVVDDDIVNLKDSGVMSMLSLMGHWRVIEGQREKGHVPQAAAKLISDPSWECGLPEIKRRVEVPFMLADGSIISTAGYHEESGVYLLPRAGDRIEVPEVPAIVTDEHIAQAKEIFEDVTEGFNFKDSSSKANLIAMTLTSPLRELFRSNPMVPMLTSTAPQSGSGKGTSIRLPLSTCGIGPYSLATTAYNPDENEFEKKLVGKLLKKSTYIFLDNIRAGVNSSVLEQMLTAANYDGRTLGYSEVNSLSTLVLWVSTLQSTGSFNRDLTRRTVPVELTKNYKGAWQHKNIDAYLADMRGQMIWACFVVARRWLDLGSPISTVRLDGYGGWTECIGGMVENVLGYENLLGNLESFRKAQDANSMTIDGILERWLTQYGETPQPARMAIEEWDDPALHQMLGMRNPGSARQVINALTRILDCQGGYIIANSHMWEPMGVQQTSQGPLKIYRCIRLED